MKESPGCLFMKRARSQRSKNETTMLPGHVTMRKVAGLPLFDFCFWSDDVGRNVCNDVFPYNRAARSCAQ